MIVIKGQTCNAELQSGIRTHCEDCALYADCSIEPAVIIRLEDWKRIKELAGGIIERIENED